MTTFHTTNLLFLCTANSARSQMAEGFARSLLEKSVRVQSAGSAPSTVDTFAIQVMAELGIDLSGYTSKPVDNIDIEGIDLIVTLCEDEACPALLSSTPRIHWPLPDPRQVRSPLSDEEQLQQFREVRDQIRMRIQVLVALQNMPQGPTPVEFHASIRVSDLPESARFYSWLLNVSPKEWTHRYVTFVSQALRTNFVLLVDDGKKLHHDTLYHLGIDVGSKQAVIDTHQRAQEAGIPIVKPARTTWRGTPLHELWLKDPDGTLIEIYARLTDEDLSEMPADKALLSLTRTSGVENLWDVGVLCIEYGVSLRQWIDGKFEAEA